MMIIQPISSLENCEQPESGDQMTRRYFCHNNRENGTYVASTCLISLIALFSTLEKFGLGLEPF